MSRALALASGLILVGLLSAGCGGGYQGAIRQGAKEWFGDGNPKILRIETVRDLGGNKQIVATIQGHFTLPPGGSFTRRTRPSKPPPFHYAWLSFSDPKGMAGEEATTASQIAAIDNAHGARPVLSIFPFTPLTAIRCVIPRGNSSATIDGRCSTHFSGPFDHPTSITFHEAWAFAQASWGTRATKGGGWIVALDPHGHVRSVSRFGDLPPQLWK